MKSSIRVLSDSLASQIAAGEVVERPSSVAKELIENALDAGASRVDLSIEGGGISLVEIADDGRGMNKKDLLLCLQRHATSKLRVFSDLETIESYGFRGEALPSLASVSRFSIKTRSADSDSGLLLSVDGSLKSKVAPVGCPVGTTVRVEELFFNVPARRKFLRSSNTESGHVGEVVSDAALARHEVSFTLVRDGRRYKKFPRVSTRRERVEQVLNEEALIECKGQRGPLEIEAYLCGPERARRGSSGLKVLVNGRPVRERSLTGTIAHAYGASLERGRFPRGVVYLRLPGNLVDVNVHPQKTEVRFASQRAVLDALHSVIGKGVGGSALTGSASAEVAAPHGSAASKGGRYVIPASISLAPRILRDGPSPVSGQRYTKDVATSTPLSSASIRNSAKESPAPLLVREPLVKRALSKEEPSLALGSSALVATSASGGRGSWRGLRFLGQANGCYLVCEAADGIHILDQHAADERRIRSQLQAAFDAGQIPSQVLLFPSTVQLSTKICDAVSLHCDDLARLGVDVRVRTEGTVSVHGIPRLLAKLSPEELLEATLKHVIGSQAKASGAWGRAISEMACLGALRPGEAISRTQAEELLKGLRKSDFESECLHGRPLLLSVSYSELGRKAGKK